MYSAHKIKIPVTGGSSRTIPSQAWESIPTPVRDHSLKHYLPVLIDAWIKVERFTGHRWNCTSYFREINAPSHIKGQAIDLAPDISLASSIKYAVTNMSDPVLYKRERLIRQLQTMAGNTKPKGPYDIGLFLEPDHIHMGVFKASGPPSFQIFKWGGPKPVYQDTLERLKLPLITT